MERPECWVRCWGEFLRSPSDLGSNGAKKSKSCCEEAILRDQWLMKIVDGYAPPAGNALGVGGRYAYR